MKKKVILSVLLSFSFYLLSSQVPQGINYQAVARDATGAILINTNLGIKIGILTDTILNKYVWEEEQNVKTNNFGIFSLVIGDPSATKIQGDINSFSEISWKGVPLFIRLKVKDGGTVWHEMGAAKLWSVPYAMTSGDLAGSVKRLQVAATETSLDSALFEVRNKDGRIVFAVYNEGVRIYVDDGLAGKGLKGGFAIGGFNKAKGIQQDYFIVNADSIRAYIDTDTAKATKGGFAIGGFNPAKREREEFLRVTRDSTRVYLNNTGTKARKGGFAIGGFNNAKGGIQDFLLISEDSIRMYINNNPVKATKGGFAVGGFNKAKGFLPQYLSVNPNRTSVQVNDSTKGFVVSNVQTGVSRNFMDMTVENYFIGYQSGSLTTPGVGDIGKYNSFMGYQTGVKNVTGKKNVYLGFQTGYESYDANYNVLIGNESGKNNSTGDNNTFIGYWSGQANNGNYNTFVGERAGNKNTTGTFNVYIGARSGLSNSASTSNYNTFVGSYSGYYSTDAANNVFIGNWSGYNNRTGDGNVFIGYQSGYNSKLSNRLYIANTSSYPPLIYGEFDNKTVVINDTLPHAMTFYVNGSAGGTGAWQNLSDARLKKNITTIADPLEKVMQLRGVEFEWKENTVNDPGRHIGFIAQEAINVVPEIVNNSGTNMSMQYAPLTAILVEAIKQQQRVIEQQQKDISEIRQLNQLLMEQNLKISSSLEELRRYVDNNLNKN